MSGYPWGKSLLYAATALGMATLASAARAEIVRIVIDQRMPVEDAGAGERAQGFELVRGRLFGEVDPTRADNAIIQDLSNAPVNARGKVEYISTFTLIRPTDPARSAGILLAPLPNRGGRGTASGRGAGGLIDPLYYDRGWSVLWIGWQGDLLERPDADTSAAKLRMESASVPRAVGRNGQPITGRYLMRIPTLGGIGPSGDIMRLDQGRAGALAHLPLNFNTVDAELTGGPAEDIEGRPTGKRYNITAGDWVWWNCATNAPADPAMRPSELCVKRTRGRFNPDETYLLVFTARDPLVLGLGMAALRDGVSFFRYQQADAQGTPNPLAGRINRVVAQGVSQVGNMVKTFIALGFNRDEAGRRVWDGANAHIAGRRTPINYRFSTPGSSATLYQPGSEGVLWWGKAVDALRGGPARSMLDRCTATDTCPKVFETYGGAELWNQRMTPGMVNFDLKADIPLPENVRRYYFPGTQHGGGKGGFAVYEAQRTTTVVGPGTGEINCTLPMNPNPEVDQLRALTIALADWVTTGKRPPDSRYPSLASHQLVRDEAGALHFPKIPGVPLPYGLANPVLVYDYGPQFDYVDMSGVITRTPPAITARIPALVPQVDPNGNEASGVASVQMMAPLGTYLSWNTYAEGPYAGQICSYYGGFVPFPRTAAERRTSADPRESIEERYHTRSGYIAAVRAAVDRAMQEGFLLPADGEQLLRQATEATEHGDLRFLRP